MNLTRFEEGLQQDSPSGRRGVFPAAVLTGAARPLRADHVADELVALRDRSANIIESDLF